MGASAPPEASGGSKGEGEEIRLLASLGRIEADAGNGSEVAPTAVARKVGEGVFVATAAIARVVATVVAASTRLLAAIASVPLAVFQAGFDAVGLREWSCLVFLEK